MANRKIVSFDWAIKNILRDKANYDVLEGFLLALLDEDIKILDLLESESNQDNKEMKYNRVDVLAKNSVGEDIIIEVQYAPEQCYFKRLLYGTSKDIIDNMKSGEHFCNVKKVYSISLIYFDVEKYPKGTKPKDYVYHGQVKFVGLHNGNEIEINSSYLDGYDEAEKGDVNVFPEYFIIPVNLFNDDVKDNLDEWIYAFKNHEIKEDFEAPGIDCMREKLDFVSMKPEQQQKYNKYREDLASDRSTLELNARKAREQGIEQGIKQGIEQGIETGENSKAIKVAEKMIIRGDSDEDIAEITELSIEQIEELRNSLK